MVAIGDRVVVVARDSMAYLRACCVVAVKGGAITVSDRGDAEECKLSDVLPYDVFLDIIGHGTKAKARLKVSLGHLEVIMHNVIDAVIRDAKEIAERERIDSTIACRAIESFLDMLSHLGAVGRALSPHTGICPDTTELYAIVRAREEILMHLSMLRGDEEEE